MNKLVRLIRMAILKAKFDDENNANFHQTIAWEAYRRYLAIKYIPLVGIPPPIDLKRDKFSFYINQDIHVESFWYPKREC
jgi:hypothetical protein